MIVVFYILVFIGTYLSIYVLYNLLLLSAHFFIKYKKTYSLIPEARFGIVIPAHNEELFLTRLIKSINEQDYPSYLFKAIVVADNCTDNTAKVGSENSALVLERNDLQHTGKGYAIKYTLEKINMNEYDAIFIIDADSIVSNDVLNELDKALREGKNIIQCYNGVANPDESWFTRLLDVSRTLGNEVFHPAKQKLGLSSYLMGNGMCFSSKVLLKYGWDAFTIGEDWEYYARLIQEGETIAFANRARVYHQESSSLKQATSQRMRWSSGRFAIAWKHGVRLFFSNLLERNIKKIDASLPLLFPNPSLGVNITIFGLISSIVYSVISNNDNLIFWFSLLLMIQLSIFIIGIMYTNNKLKNLLSLLVAPLFLLWKMGIDLLSALGMGSKKWIRTERKF